MFTWRFMILPLAFLLTSISVSSGQDLEVGESVIVSADNADVMVKQRKLGSVPRGTKFEIRQHTPTWLLGEFRIGDKAVLGWVRHESVRRAQPDISEVRTHDFTWENLLFAMIKHDEHFYFDMHVEDYMKAFRPEVWKRCQNDEFQLAKKKAQALREFQELVDAFDVERDFLIRANLTIGKYDFDRSAFPIEEGTATHYWYEDHYTSGGFPGTIKVFFKNPELIRFLPMPSEKAEQLLSARKNGRGDINRRISGDIRVRISLKRLRKGELWGEIRWAQFFSDKNRNVPLYETPKPPPTESPTPDGPRSDRGEAAADTDE